MVADPWRIFVRDQHAYLQPIRKQSLAFVTGEGLATVPLAFGGKEFLTQAVGEFRYWDALDDLPQSNWAAKLPPRSSSRAIVDIDVDIDPLDNVWTRAREAEIRLLTDKILATVVKIGGLDGRYRFGRASLGHDGHLWLVIDFANKTGLNRLLTLGMRKPVVIGDYRLRIEVRVAPDPRQPDPKKAVTLPGSIYRSNTGDGYDVIGWRYQLPPDEIPVALPALAPQPLEGLARGLWAGLLAAVLDPHWIEGARHELALQLTGILAREVMIEGGFLDEEQARRVLETLCLLYADDELPDRLQTLEASLATVQSGRPVTGYARLAETIGEDAKLALLRLRGGADPDAYASLLENVAYVASAKGQSDVFVDLTMQGHGDYICSRAAIIRHFHPHPHYPAVAQPRGRQIPLIEVVLGSRNLQRYHAAVDLPGIPFRTILMNGHQGYRVAEETEVADLTLPRLLNVGPGFATPCPEAPEPEAWERWYTLWHRHLGPVCGRSQAAVDILNKAIAWAIQHPLDKLKLGFCLSGDNNIGKSVIFEHILPAIVGAHVVAKVNALNLEDQFRLDDLEGKKFYIIEEINLAVTNTSIKELLKDLMKNTRMRVNRKYGAKGDIHNFSLPFFLTNEREANLTIRGQPERSLVLIPGDTRERLRLSPAQWDAHTQAIAGHVKEFLAALQEPAVREAGMFFFANLEVERADFDDHGELGSVLDPRDSLDPLDEAILGMLEANEVWSRLRNQVPLTAPFKMEWLTAGLLERLRERNASRYRVVEHVVSRRLSAILGPNSVTLIRFRDATGTRRRMHYFTARYGTLISKASEHFGFPVEPAYELEEAADFGPNEPSTDDARRVWDTPLTGGGISY